VTTQCFGQAQSVLPGSVNSTARTTYAGWEPYPLFAAGGEGPYLLDVDGHRYLDYLLALGPLMLGHQPAAVSARVAEAVSLLRTAYDGPMADREVAVIHIAPDHVVPLGSRLF